MNRLVLRALRPHCGPGARHAHATEQIALMLAVAAEMTGDWTVRGRH